MRLSDKTTRILITIWACLLPPAAGVLYSYAGQLLSLKSAIFNAAGYLAFALITIGFIASIIQLVNSLTKYNK